MPRTPKPLDAESYDRWRKYHDGGKMRYVILFGVLGWGLITAFLFSVYPLLFGNPFDWSRALSSFVAFPIGGIFWGLYTWHSMEKRYAIGPGE